MMFYINKELGEFPSGLVVRSCCFHLCGAGSIPGLGTKNPTSNTAAHHGQGKKKKKLKTKKQKAHTEKHKVLEMDKEEGLFPAHAEY